MEQCSFKVVSTRQCELMSLAKRVLWFFSSFRLLRSYRSNDFSGQINCLPTFKLNKTWKILKQPSHKKSVALLHRLVSKIRIENSVTTRKTLCRDPRGAVSLVDIISNFLIFILPCRRIMGNCSACHATRTYTERWSRAYTYSWVPK